MGRGETLIMECSLGLRYRFKSVHTVPDEVDADGNPLVHGHNYELFLRFTKKCLNNDWVISRDLANSIVKNKILKHAHNKNLDHWIQPATGEKICHKIYYELKDTEIGPLLTEITLIETLKNTFILRTYG